jgi:DNA (cytosine-5)-methyltransferase 1
MTAGTDGFFSVEDWLLCSAEMSTKYCVDKSIVMSTISHMINTGNELRKARVEAGISQARFAELTGLSQQALSAFELGKASLKSAELHEVNNVFPNLNGFDNILSRKKRYQKHVYNEIPVDLERASRSTVTTNNSAYLEALKSLEIIPDPKYTAVSFFSGIGGFSLGFQSGGFKVKGYVEIDDGLASIYQANFPNVERLGSDITKVDSEKLKDFRDRVGEIDVVIGGPPCQGFSLSGKREIDDPRNYLFQDYLRAIDILAPKFAIVENVRLLTSMKSKDGGLVKDDIIAGLKQHGYSAKLFQLNAKNYGVPQHRERVIFLAVRDDLKVNPTLPSSCLSELSSLFEGKNTHLTFGDACSDLPFLESGHSSKNDPMHKAVKHPQHVLDWLWDVPEGRSAHDNEDLNLRPPSGYNTTYKRQVWTEPASTVQTTFGMISGCRNVHPIATRSLTVREACRLQSFPDNYRLPGSLGTVRTGIGNAVPPLLAKEIATHLASLLDDFIEISGL